MESRHEKCVNFALQKLYSGEIEHEYLVLNLDNKKIEKPGIEGVTSGMYIKEF